MSLKTLSALLLVALCVPADAQEAAGASEQPLEPAASNQPSLEPIHKAFISSRLPQVATRVRVTFDASGRILDAEVDPSTGDRGLDKAIRTWAKRVRLKPGAPGTGWLPIEMSRTR